MSRVGEGELLYINQGIQAGVRTDGRGRGDIRPADIELNVIAQAHGSARLHMGDTDVLVGVKVDLGSPDSSTPDRGSLYVTVECSSCASPEFKGRGGEDWGIELAKALEASINGKPEAPAFDLGSLCVVSGKACWVVYVDALVLNEGGDVLGALSLAARAALAVTCVPKVEVSMAEDDDEPEIEVSDERDSVPLNVANVPVIISIGQVGSQSVVDLSAEEEPCASACLHVAVNRQGLLCGFTKNGTGGLDPSLMQEMLEIAQKLGPQVISSMDAYLGQQSVKPALFNA